MAERGSVVEKLYGGRRYRVEAYMDDIPIHPHRLWCQAQSKPYPGGHRYRLTVRGEGVRRLLLGNLDVAIDEDGSGHERVNAIDSDTSFDILRRLYSRLFPPLCTYGPDYDYVLNSVERMELGPDGVTLYGEASEFIRAARQAQPR